MSDIVVKGGYVYDPLNGIDGEKKDIFISGGKVVERLKGRGAKIVNALSLIHI